MLYIYQNLFKQMNHRRLNNEETKSKRSKLIRRIVQANNDGSASTRKSYSPSNYNINNNYSSNKSNITNNIIMRRQLNAINDISPPKGKYGYAFIYDQSQGNIKGKMFLYIYRIFEYRIWKENTATNF